MSNFDKILEKIENQHIEPTPKWFFRIKNLWFWLAFGFSIFIGSISFSIILYSIQQTDFELLQHVQHSKIETFLVLLPYFWIVLLILFSILAFFSFKSFKNAYKHSLLSIIGLSTFLSVLIGTLIFISGFGSLIENKFANKVELYKSIKERKLQHWMNPEEGFLAGKILIVKKDTLIIQDFDEKIWTVYYSDIFIPPVLEIEKDENIKIIGKKKSDNLFHVLEIRPWRVGRNNQRVKKK